MQSLKQDVIQARGRVYINRNKNDFRSVSFSQIRFSHPNLLWFELYENKKKIAGKKSSNRYCGRKFG